MKTGKKTGSLLLAFVAGVMGGGMVSAADVYELNPIVVTAQRAKTVELDTPASVEVITAKDLERTGRTSVYEALSHVTGFTSMSWGGVVQDYAMSTSRITMRGFDKGTLVMVDGAPMNLLNYNTASGIPVEAVERIEVVKGASSVLYGAEAMAGVVNIVTKKPSGQARGRIGGSVGNYASDWHVGADLGKASLYYSRQFADTLYHTDRKGVYKFNKKAQKYVLTDQHGVDKGKSDHVFFTSALSDNLRLNWNYYNQESHRPTYVGASDTRSVLYDYKDIRNNVNLIYDDEESDVHSVLAYNKRNAQADKYDYKTGKESPSSQYNMYSWTTDTQKTWHFREGKDRFIGGVAFSRENYNGYTGGKVDKVNSAHRNNISLYGSYAREVSPKWTVIVGLRGEHSDDYAKDQNVILPQFQTLYKINPNTSWFVNVGRSFQMPPLNQYFSKPDANFNVLKPQQGWTYETGIKWANDRSSLKVSLYHIYMKDAFKWEKNTVDDSNYLINAGEFRNTGIEADWRQRIDDVWSYHAGITFANPEDNESGSWKRNNSAFQWTAGVSYSKDKWDADLSYLYLGKRENSYYYHSDGSSMELAPLMDLTANIRYRPNQDQVLSLRFNNILDRENSVNKYENLGLPYNWTLSWELAF